MPTGLSSSPKILKGAIIAFSSPMLIPIPNVILFQYNPESMTRTLSPWQPAEREYDEETGEIVQLSRRQLRSLAQPWDPQENFSLALELDAADALEEPESHPVAVISGVADRIAALEILLYPPKDEGLLGSLSAGLSVSVGGSLSASLTGGAQATLVERLTVPIVLFFWGPGRIVPVRLTSFEVEEQAFSPLLYPLRAKVTVGLRVLDEDDLVNAAGVSGPETFTVKLAKACYVFTKTQKQVLALANLANTVESIMDMLPS
jgi:hypothetical protein